jgi:phosphoglycerate dehydrogenase-like enzyme
MQVGPLLFRLTRDLKSLHCPLFESTRYLIDAAAIARMKPGVTLIDAGASVRML